VRYLSVCSGIEAASVAWESLGWTPVAFAEIEKFPSKVLAHHYPGVANLGDMTKFREWDIERNAVDILVGGTPCQSFSVAGLRKGLDDPRGNLALTFIAMVDHYRPEWVIWENVPGVLSSSGGRDFGSFLGALGQLGYGFAYRVLDAQYFGVPQRRRRVFVVAHSSGDSRRAAEVLFEPESLRGDSPKGRKTGQDTAQCLTTGTGCRYDPNTETLIPVMYQHNQTDARLKEETRTSQTVLSRWGTGGRNTPLVGQPIALAENTIGRQPMNGGNGDGYTVGGPMYTLNATGVHGVAHPAHAFKIRGIGHYTGTNGGVAKPGTGGSGYMGQDEKAYTIATSQDQQIMHGMAVRRLTPTECERLQGFPDGYTDIMPETPDGPRYKALGNSMAVPVMRWIGSRIALATK
jgi:DNA (cytosine-5)-methyltransferase 1